MQNDDQQVGQIVNRREAIILLGLTGASLISGCSRGESVNVASGQTANAGSGAQAGAATSPAPGCVVRPQETAGPYYVDEKLNRSDIRSDPSDGSVKEGAPFELTFNVSQIGNAGCAPLASAIVDVWHCDALGVYSDVHDANGFFDTKGKKFLRGYQLTDTSGRAVFRAIYPGWYEGRTVHIHFTIRNGGGAAGGNEFTSQLYFADSDNDRILSQAPYSTKGQRTMKNDDDGIFRENGSLLIVAVQPAWKGYTGTVDIALQLA